MKIKLYDTINVITDVYLTEKEYLDIVNVRTTPKYVDDYYIGNTYDGDSWVNVNFIKDDIVSGVSIKGMYDYVDVVPLKHSYDILLFKEIWNIKDKPVKIEPVKVDALRDL